MDILDVLAWCAALFLAVEVIVIAQAATSAKEDLKRQTKLQTLALATTPGGFPLIGREASAWPSGPGSVVKIEGSLWDVIDQDGRSPTGKIKVVGVKGLRLVVEQIN